MSASGRIRTLDTSNESTPNIAMHRSGYSRLRRLLPPGDCRRSASPEHRRDCRGDGASELHAFPRYLDVQFANCSH